MAIDSRRVHAVHDGSRGVDDGAPAAHAGRERVSAALRPRAVPRHVYAGGGSAAGGTREVGGGVQWPVDYSCACRTAAVSARRRPRAQRMRKAQRRQKNMGTHGASEG
eukprot:scaffold53_cov193-Pinguiococcus_pyrenoidosus.AAC.75